MANETELSYPSSFCQQFFDRNGKPLAAGRLYTYKAGSNEPAVTYKAIDDTSSAANRNTNPIILDNAGYARLVIEIGKSYKFVLCDRHGTKIMEWDNVTAGGGSGGGGSGEYEAQLPLKKVNGKFTNNGVNLTCSGNNSWAEGNRTKSTGEQSHSEGYSTEASGNYAHAEGCYSKAIQGSSHAEGFNTRADAVAAHAEGYESVASGNHSHAEGSRCTASGKASHAGGLVTRMSADGGTAIGKFNSEDNALFVVGNGTYVDNRKDAFIVDLNGQTHITNESGNLVKLRGAGIATFTVTQTDANTYVYPSESDVRAAIPNYDTVILRLAPLGGGFINYILDNQAVAVGVVTSYTWVREDNSRKITLSGAGNPVVWTWNETSIDNTIESEPSYFITINGTKYPCTKIHCPNAASYNDNALTSKWSLWMTENLRESLGTIGTNEWYVNGDQNLSDTKKYGRLYTWNLAHQFEDDLVSLGLRANSDLRSGWHLPLTNEVNALRDVDAKGDIYFKPGIINASNKSGLSLDLTGRFNASQSKIQNWQSYGYWWCTQESNASNAQGMYGINYNSSSFNTTAFPKANGNAIRLTIHLKDDGSIPAEFENYITVEYKDNIKDVKTICGKSYALNSDGNYIPFDGSSAVFDGIVNVDDFGAAGDGVTDDTACFQMAISYNLGVTGTRGKSYFVKDLSVGAGTRRTIFKNITFTSPKNKADDCLIVTAYSEIDGCTFTNFNNAIKAARSSRPVINARITNCRISNCKNGIWMFTDSSWSSDNSVDIFDILIEKNYITEIGTQLGSNSKPPDLGWGRGIKAHGHMDGVKILNNVIEYCWCGIEIGNDCSYFWAPGWSIENNFFEGHSIAPIYISSFSYQGNYDNVDRRCQLSVCGNYFSDYNGGTKNPVYGTYDFWIEDWTPSIYPCYGNQKDIIGMIKSGTAVMNNGVAKGTSFLFLCGPDISKETGSQMKDTALTIFPGYKKYYYTLTYPMRMVLKIDAHLSSSMTLSNVDNNVTINDGYQEITLINKSVNYTASRLLTGDEYIRIIAIDCF